MDFGETSLGVDGMAMVFNEIKQWPIGIEPLVRSSGNQINKETRRQAIVVYCKLPTKNSRDKISISNPVQFHSEPILLS